MKIEKNTIIVTKIDKYLIHRVWYDQLYDLTLLEVTSENRENDSIGSIYYLEDFLHLLTIEQVISMTKIKQIKSSFD